MSRLARSLGALVAVSLSTAACGASPTAVDEPPPPAVAAEPAPPALDPAVLAQWVAECDVVIGFINRGVAQIEAMAPGSAPDGSSQIGAMATSMEQIAGELEAQRFTSPDLTRLAGWYVGMARATAQSARELDVALAGGDEAQIEHAATKLEQVTAQEDAIVDDINRYCGPP